MIRIAVITEARLYREALAHVLDVVPGMSVVGTAATAETARTVLADRQVDVALLDTRSVPAASIAILLELHPQLHVVALAIEEVAEQVVAWIEAGASGFVSSELSLDELVLAIEAVTRGELRCSATVTHALVRRLRGLAAAAPREADTYRLTPRQHEVIELMARGLTNKEIARALDVSLPTVKNHVHNIFEKLQVHRRADALARLGRSYRPQVYSA